MFFPHRAIFRVKCCLWLSIGWRVWIAGEDDHRNSLAGRRAVVFIRGCKPIYGALVLDFGTKNGIGILLCSGHWTACEWDSQDLGFGQIVIQWPVEWFAYQRYCNVCHIHVVDYIGNLTLSCGTLVGNEKKSSFGKFHLPIVDTVSSSSCLPKNPDVYEPMIETNFPWIPRHCAWTEGTEHSKGANLDVRHTLIETWGLL